MPLLSISRLTFVGLNAVRVVSLVTMVLVWVAILIMMIQDAQDFNDPDLRAQAEEEDCTYIPGTEIPTHTWGVFWAELHRAFLLIILAAVIVSEVCWGRLRDVIFPQCTPMLSKYWSVMPLGVLQMVIASSVLSHYMDDFPLVVAWLLFCVGVLNVLVGLWFGSRMKGLRSIFADRRVKARALESGPGGRALYGEKASYATAKTSKPKDVRSYGAIDRAKGKSIFSLKFKGSPRGKGIDKPSINDDFPSIETDSQRELLRQRAREANARAERQQDAFETTIPIDLNNTAVDRASQTLSSTFVWDQQTGMIHERQGDGSTSGMRRRHPIDLGHSPKVPIGGYATAHARAASRTSNRTASVAGSMSGSQVDGRTTPRRTPKKHRVGGGLVPANGSKATYSPGPGIASVRALKRGSTALAKMAKARMSGGLKGTAPRTEADDEGTLSVIVHGGEEGGRMRSSYAPPPPPKPAYRAPRDIVEDVADADPSASGRSQHRLPIASQFTRG